MFGSPSRARTCDIPVNSRTLYQLSYRGIWLLCHDSNVNKRHQKPLCYRYTTEQCAIINIIFLMLSVGTAETTGFEPAERFEDVRRFSKPLPSAYSGTSPLYQLRFYLQHNMRYAVIKIIDVSRAEAPRFELGRRLSTPARFRGECIQPLCQTSARLTRDKY